MIHPTVGIVTDSNSQFPDDLRDRFGVEVVSLRVTIDGETFDEGTELTADDFYGRLARGAQDISTAAPSPGSFLQAYARLAERGVERILSIHIGADVSGTINAARLAAEAADVPVDLVDTGTASFGVSCCVWEAAQALAGGATAEEAKAIAETTAPTVGNVFVVGALDLAASGGRLAPGTTAGEGVPVLSLIDGQMQRVGVAADVGAAAEAMATFVTADRHDLRVAVGVADTGAAALWQALEDRLATDAAVRETVRYRIGPSVGVHTGPGTAGAFFWPARSM